MCCEFFIFQQKNMMFFCWIYQNFTIFLFFFHIAQGSVTTYLKYGEKNNMVFIANSLLNARVKEFLNYANVWQSYERIISKQLYVGVFWLGVYSVHGSLWLMGDVVQIIARSHWTTMLLHIMTARWKWFTGRDAKVSLELGWLELRQLLDRFWSS